MSSCAEQSQPSVLVVEDHPPLRELIATVLGDAGYQVFAAATGEEALRLASGVSVDLVLTDVTLPGMSGPALIEQLRGQSREMRVVVMSGHDRRFQDAYFLQKPFTPKSLRAVIAKALLA